MEFYGLLGEKLSHSLSPEIHSEILKLMNKAGGYKLFEVNRDRLNDFIEALKLLKIKGCNVTIPYKKDIMQYVDFLSDEANKIGAINTICLNEGKLYGYNTDYFGFGSTFERNQITFKDKIVVILGTGGACKAALTYILDNEVKELYLVSRNPEYVELNIKDRRLNIINYDKLKEVEGDIIINSTPVGMYPNNDKCPIDKAIIDNYDIVMDLIYNPLETKLLEYGREKEKLILDGLYMLVAQAVKAQEIFQGTNIDNSIIDIIYDSLKDRFK